MVIFLKKMDGLKEGLKKVTRHCEERKRRGNPCSPGSWIATAYGLAMTKVTQ
jgi:hypothetical protein